MNARHATPSDRDFFLSSWFDYLVEMHTKGSEIIPSDYTMDHYAQLFDVYTLGTREGVVAICGSVAESAAVSMAGDCTPPWDSDNGKTAIGWGTYVIPQFRSQHCADLLREFIIRELGSMGFRTLLGTVGVSDAQALASIRRVPDVEVIQYVYRRRLA